MSRSGVYARELIFGGGNSDIFLIFIPNFGEMIQFDEHIFQMGWFNHQLVMENLWKMIFPYFSLSIFDVVPAVKICSGVSIVYPSRP